MIPRLFSSKVSLLSLGAAVLCVNGLKAATPEVSFEREVKPLLERSCAACHSGEKPKGKFSVESREGLLKGGESKEAAMVVGKGAESALVKFTAGQVAEME